MPVPTALSEPSSATGSPSLVRRIAVVRALIALLWAGALALALGDDVRRAGDELPVLAALLLTAYPLIDAIASLVEVRREAASTVLLVNAAIGGLAAAALAAASLGAGAGAVLAVFGAWALLSGAIQLGVALQRRGSGDRQVFMILSGGLSAVIGLLFVAGSPQDDVDLTSVAGYAVGGAVLYLLGAAFGRGGAARA